MKSESVFLLLFALPDKRLNGATKRTRGLRQVLSGSGGRGVAIGFVLSVIVKRGVASGSVLSVTGKKFSHSD